MDGGHFLHRGLPRSQTADYRDSPACSWTSPPSPSLIGQSDVRIRLLFSEDGGSVRPAWAPRSIMCAVKAAPRDGKRFQTSGAEAVFAEPAGPGRLSGRRRNWKKGVCNLPVYALGLDHLETPALGPSQVRCRASSISPDERMPMPIFLVGKQPNPRSRLNGTSSPTRTRQTPPGRWNENRNLHSEGSEGLSHPRHTANPASRGVGK